MKKEKDYSVQVKLTAIEILGVIKAIEGFIARSKDTWEFREVLALHPKFKALDKEIDKQRQKDEKRCR